jgi:hypothetical protein
MQTLSRAVRDHDGMWDVADATPTSHPEYSASIRTSMRSKRLFNTKSECSACLSHKRGGVKPRLSLLAWTDSSIAIAKWVFVTLFC